MKWLLSLVLVLLAVGTLRVVGCGGDECGGCDDGDPCTEDRCVYAPEGFWNIDLNIGCSPEDPNDYHCTHRTRPDGFPCGGGNVCVDGGCTENLCQDVVCDDGLGCTEDECDFRDGTCHFPNLCDDENECTEDICDPDNGLCDFTTLAEDGSRCDFTLDPGHGDPLRLIGVCEAGVCVAGVCNPESIEIYQCPLEEIDSYCCPGWDYCIRGSPCPPPPDVGAFELQP